MVFLRVYYLLKNFIWPLSSLQDSGLRMLFIYRVYVRKETYSLDSKE